jgi:hypothetical protein
MRWAGHVAFTDNRKGAHRVLVGKPEGKRHLERPMSRRKYSIKTYLQDVGLGDMNWIDLAQDRDRWGAFVNAVMNLRGPQNPGNFLTS